MISLLAAIAAAQPPTLRELRAAVEEVRQNVDGIRTKVVAYKALNGIYYPCGTPEEARLRGARYDRSPWLGGACWTVLAFADAGMLRGGYWVTTIGAGFEIHGVIDADGDGVFAEYVATAEKAATTLTPADEY